MASEEADAARLDTRQRWEVLCIYRRQRLGAAVGGTHPLDALRATRGVLAYWCALAVLDEDPVTARIRARQCAYVGFLTRKWLARR